MPANQAWIFRTSISWNGDDVIKRIQEGSLKGGAKAGLFYKNLVQKKLRRTKGSRALSGNLRLRVRHSAPDGIPFWQTGNLANSVKLTSSVKKGKGSIHHFRISTRVSYAVTLEKGNPQVSIPQGLKRFTSIRLVNPLKSRPTVSARPVWLPTFNQTWRAMVGIISDEIRKA